MFLFEMRVQLGLPAELDGRVVVPAGELASAALHAEALVVVTLRHGVEHGEAVL